MYPNQPQPQQQPPPAPGYYLQPSQPYYYPHPVQPQPPVQPVAAAQMRIITRPPFPHGKHIRWSIFSAGAWLVMGYLPAYCWHRFGPTKAVTTGTFG